MPEPSEVSAIIVTRGDKDLSTIIRTLIFDDVVVWDNSKFPDIKLFGRYAAIHLARGSYVYFQDDDAIVPQAAQEALCALSGPGRLAVNMPAGHNLGHPELHLLGWGSVAPRWLPSACLATAYRRLGWDPGSEEFMRLGCDIAVSVLAADKVRADLGHVDMSYAHAPDRVHRDPEYPALKDRLYGEAVALRAKLLSEWAEREPRQVLPSGPA